MESNGSIIYFRKENGSTTPIAVDNINRGIAIMDWLHHEVHEGEMFTSNLLVTNVANNGYLRLRFTTGTKSAHVNNIQILTEGKAYLKTYSGTTYSAAGTLPDANLTRFVRNTGNVQVSTSTLYYNPTINVIGTLRGNQLIPGESSKKGSGSIISSIIETIIKPNSEILIEVQNVSSATSDICIVLDWYEE